MITELYRGLHYLRQQTIPAKCSEEAKPLARHYDGRKERIYKIVGMTIAVLETIVSIAIPVIACIGLLGLFIGGMFLVLSPATEVIGIVMILTGALGLYGGSWIAMVGGFLNGSWAVKQSDEFL